MSNELLLLIKKHSDTLIEMTKTKPQETLEFKMNKQLQTFSFNPPTNLSEEGIWLSAVISFEAMNSVFNITDENNSFSISTPGHSNSKDGEELINKLNKLLELRSENDIELHVKEIRKRGDQIKIGDNEYLKFSDLDIRKESINKELKRVNYRDREDMAYRLQLTYDEFFDILDVKFRAGLTKGYTLVPGNYEVSDINKMLKSLLPEEVKVNVTTDDIRLKSNLTTNETIRFTKKSFFFVISGFT